MRQDKLRKEVKEIYSRAIVEKSNLCISTQGKLPDESCCTCNPKQYELILSHLPSPSQDLSFGCGNPLSYHNLHPQEVVVDIGSGTGLDVMLAALKAPQGKAIGVDFTKEMVRIASKNATLAGISNAKFLLAEVENLPLQNSSASLVISNCVINLIPDKERAFCEIARILKPGGFLLISDIVSKEPIPDNLRQDPKLWSSCISGAITEEEYLSLISKSGVRGLVVLEKKIIDAAGLKLFSITVKGLKPKQNAILKIKKLTCQDSKNLFLIPEEPFWFKTSEKVSRLLKDACLTEGKGANTQNQDLIAELQVREIAIEQPPQITSYPGRQKFMKTESLSELWLHITQQCNLQCKHCLVTASSKKEEVLTFKELVTLIEEARGLGVSRFYLTGGEPFLRKDVKDLIDFITEGSNLVILTNGTLIKPFVPYLSQKRLLLQVSLESHLPSVHEAIRGEGSFKPALQGIKNLLSSGINPVIATTLTKINAPYLAETAHYLAELGIKHLHILFLHPRGRASFNRDLIVSSEEAAKAIRNLYETISGLDIKIDNFTAFRARLSGNRGVKYDLCTAGYETLAVGNDGQVYPCPALIGVTEFSCGSIREEKLKSIWLKDATIRKIRTQSLAKNHECLQCDMRFICGGGCLSFKYFSTGKLNGTDPYCKIYHYILQSQLAELSANLNNTKENFQTSMCKMFSWENTVKSFHCACVLTTDHRLAEKEECNVQEKSC